MPFVIEPRPYSDPEVTRLVGEVQDLYVQMYGEPDSAAVEDDEFVAPNGVMLVGTLDGTVVAMGGWRRHQSAANGEHVAELKRMYVAKAAQRRGLGRLMLAAVEDSARQAGITRLVLNTGPHQDAAIALYAADGYTPSEPFGHYATYGDALFFAKSL